MYPFHLKVEIDLSTLILFYKERLQGTERTTLIIFYKERL